MRQATRLLNIALAVSLVGCALPAHNNTLIFAVHRKVGIDITPTNATNAGLTIGYASNEFAWVPLWANDGDKKPMTHCMTDEQIKSKSCGEGFRPKFVGVDHGNAGKDEDAYSVFASFGGSVAAQTEAGQPSASLNIASFFATGIAAQNLADKGNELTAVARAGGKKVTSASAEQAKNQLFTLFKLIAQGESTNAKMPLACLTVIAKEFDPKQESRFDYLAGSTPTYAASNILSAFNFTDDEYRTLGGIAYRQTDKAKAAADAAFKNDPKTDKSATARVSMGCATPVTQPAVLPPAGSASAPAAPAPATVASAPKS